MTRVLALLVLAVTASAQTQQPCTTHSDCTEQQYCSDYTSEAGTNIVSCYPCVDAYQFTCSEYGDSVDASCAQCAEEEAAHGEGSYNYINCESSATCAENMYCYRTNFDGFVVQDCWPCADSNGYSCEDYGDAVDGNCSSCVGSLPATNGCTTHAECSAGSYCSSYQNAAGTGIIVTCNPCVDSYGYTCQDYDDPVDGSCEICAGIEGPSAGGGDFGIGGPPPSSAPAVDLACHANPIAPETSVAFQSCSGHGDCRKGEYCSAYMGNAGCVIDCWPCTDMYGLSCTDYGDSIDMKCETCAAKEDKGAAPASSEPAAAAADTGCKAHAECPSEHYCATIGDHTHCVECAGESNATTTCQVRRICKQRQTEALSANAVALLAWLLRLFSLRSR